MLAPQGIGEITRGCDLARLILDAAGGSDWIFADNDVVVLAQKIVSKAEGRTRRLGDIQPSRAATELAGKTFKDARLVELMLQESDEIVRQKPGVVVVAHRRGWIMANAGIDQSNIAGGDETILLLPEDPDQTAASLREAVRAATGALVGVVIADSFGRAWRKGTTGVSLGSAGFEALEDWRGLADRHGRVLAHTEIARADEIAAAAGLLMGQADEGRPLLFMRGVPIRPSDTGASADLIRPKAEDMFR
ncbi:MAG: coenzyme F420-0:L-glutamate ligase [Bordetella sp.]|nr:coenzyme F420-0:L-glutamate ligase [Bordetella sp.]